MENRATILDPELVNVQRVNGNFFLNDLPVETTQKNPELERLASEGHQTFFNYLEWLGLTKAPNLIVLSPSHHYYYDAEEMEDVTTVLNLKQLNHIKHIKDFVNTVYHILSPKSYFVGCFVDRKYQFGFLPNSSTPQANEEGSADQLENGISSRIPLVNRMYNFMDSRTNRNLTKKTVTVLLEDAGLKVLDMTEINGLTCFCSQKVRSSAGYE